LAVIAVRVFSAFSEKVWLLATSGRSDPRFRPLQRSLTRAHHARIRPNGEKKRLDSRDLNENRVELVGV